ncbi:hypothetical protein M501DRAFT_930614 [Patellaria atrata CBS 101060]|uniref:AAA+ ATPase domain-containing protein n=1 Tax=Patellaria atrata CBS 101060 TaxID=1346257 RepID=A0A9P4SD78_9PEZI|nr:hypothetical protein M501DRAFT_930614 [Patellaria atrata CBS 101060]
MPPKTSRELAITNPLVLYRALLATNKVRQDPGQYRLALHLQKLYERLKDYSPTVQYSERLRQISRTLGTPEASPNVQDRGFSGGGIWSSLLSQKESIDSLALTRVLTSHEAAQNLDSPKGLLLHGEVGTGKSMLVDLFADCLPNRKKRRWHFNTFMLEIIAQLEQLRHNRLGEFSSTYGQSDDHSLVWVASKVIQESPILFLDEFQLPDRATSKIMSNLLTSFFHLGGVLIATSNRMPEDLANAAGVEFSHPPSRLHSIKWKLGMRAPMGRRSGNMFAGQGEFAAFLEVLRARCDVWQMEGAKDYRRHEGDAKHISMGLHLNDSTQNMFPTNPVLDDTKSAASDGDGIPDLGSRGRLPQQYHLTPDTEQVNLGYWTRLYNAAVPRTDVEGPLDSSGWASGSMRVYGREVIVPRQNSGVTCWTFSELCGSRLGPADMITLASTYHTLILLSVPLLTVLQKNEARRFITLLDALYEARCKLMVTAAADPDGIFFPETKASIPIELTDKGEPADSVDAVHPETFSEIHQDLTSPFRPNISSYSADYSSEPDYTHARLKGILSDDAIEDDPPNRVRRNSDNFSFQDDGHSERKVDPRSPNFAQTAAFTGEDEKFAYKRAASRLWEMCGTKWWDREGDWWRPIPKEIRRWERPIDASSVQQGTDTLISDSRRIGSEGLGESQDLSEKDKDTLFKDGASPFRTSSERTPKFGWVHAWGMAQWGKKAGSWGKGVDGLNERKRERYSGEEFMKKEG